jgi:hypothetical protein
MCLIYWKVTVPASCIFESASLHSHLTLSILVLAMTCLLFRRVRFERYIPGRLLFSLAGMKTGRQDSSLSHLALILV